MTRAQWKKRGPRGTAPSLEERLAGMRVRPNEGEAAELVRRWYTMFEHMYKRGDAVLKRGIDDSASPAPQKRTKLANYAHLNESIQAAAEQRSSRLKYVVDERALLQEDIAKAREKQAKADAAYADALAVKTEADAAVALLTDQLKQNKLAAEETDRLQRELEARRWIRDRRDRDTPSPGKEPEQLIKKEPSS